jgi:hypothetical protein
VTKLARQPIAFGSTRWGPLPETEDTYLFWGGPGDGLFMTCGIDGPQRRIAHRSACGIYGTTKDAQRAVDAFVAAFYDDEEDE